MGLTAYFSRNNKTFTHLIFLLLVGAVAYLPYLFSWGFYRDDWHVLWGQNAIGYLNIFTQHKIDRPLMGLVYMITSFLIRNNAVLWMLLGFFLRIGGGAVVYFLVQNLWPVLKNRAVYIAVLFSIYPGFMQLPNANSYHVHLIALDAGLLSLLLTVLLEEKRELAAKICLTIVSVLSAVLCYGMFEWMISLEAVRLLIFLFYKKTSNSTLKTVILSLFQKKIIPYWTGMGAFLVWRIFFFKNARSSTDLGLVLNQFKSNPLENSISLLLELCKSWLNSVFGAWFVPVYELVQNISIKDVGIVLISTIVGAFLIAYFFKCTLLSDENENKSIWKTVSIFGGVWVFISIAPVILVGRSIVFEDGMERYSLLASLGSILLVIGLIEINILNSWKKGVYFCLILSAITLQLLNGAYFARFWDLQRQAWWQISWRIPDVKDGTVFLLNMPNGGQLAEDYEVWGPANLIYRPGSENVKILGDSFSKETLHKVLFNSNFGRTLRTIEYSGNYANSLVLSFPSGSCVHLIDPENPMYSLNDDLSVWQISEHSNPDLVQVNESPRIPRSDIFGWEPEKKWCYFYEKISLANQKQDWDLSLKIAKDVKDNHLTPQDVSEWMPFYIMYAKLKMYDEANEIASYLRNEPYLVENYCVKIRQNQKETSEFYINNLCPNP